VCWSSVAALLSLALEDPKPLADGARRRVALVLDIAIIVIVDDHLDRSDVEALV
jgi:hypothetical protein